VDRKKQAREDRKRRQQAQQEKKTSRKALRQGTFEPMVIDPITEEDIEQAKRLDQLFIQALNNRLQKMKEKNESGHLEFEQQMKRVRKHVFQSIQKAGERRSKIKQHFAGNQRGITISDILKDGSRPVVVEIEEEESDEEIVTIRVNAGQYLHIVDALNCLREEEGPQIICLNQGDTVVQKNFEFTSENTSSKRETTWSFDRPSININFDDGYSRTQNPNLDLAFILPTSFTPLPDFSVVASRCVHFNFPVLENGGMVSPKNENSVDYQNVQAEVRKICSIFEQGFISQFEYEKRMDEVTDGKWRFEKQYTSPPPTSQQQNGQIKPNTEDIREANSHKETKAPKEDTPELKEHIPKLKRFKKRRENNNTEKQPEPQKKIRPKGMRRQFSPVLERRDDSDPFLQRMAYLKNKGTAIKKMNICKELTSYLNLLLPRESDDEYGNLSSSHFTETDESDPESDDKKRKNRERRARRLKKKPPKRTRLLRHPLKEFTYFATLGLIPPPTLVDVMSSLEELQNEEAKAEALLLESNDQSSFYSTSIKDDSSSTSLHNIYNMPSMALEINKSQPVKESQDNSNHGNQSDISNHDEKPQKFVHFEEEEADNEVIGGYDDQDEDPMDF